MPFNPPILFKVLLEHLNFFDKKMRFWNFSYLITWYKGLCQFHVVVNDKLRHESLEDYDDKKRGQGANDGYLNTVAEREEINPIWNPIVFFFK